jgi:hypothetical protein
LPIGRRLRHVQELLAWWCFRVAGGCAASASGAQWFGLYALPSECSPKKRIEAHQLSDEDDEEFVAKGCALIRAQLGINPDELDEEEWSERFGEALWLERRQIRMLAELLGRVLGG